MAAYPRYEEGGAEAFFHGGFPVCHDAQAIHGLITPRTVYNASRTARELFDHADEYDFTQPAIDEDNANSGLVRVRLYDEKALEGRIGLLNSPRAKSAGSFISAVGALEKFV